MNIVYNSVCLDFFGQNYLNLVNKWLFFGFFVVVWEMVVNLINIWSGFCVCGIYLFNFNVVSFLMMRLFKLFDIFLMFYDYFGLNE